MNKVFRLALLLLAILTIVSCGSRKSPTGGPEDIEKPEVLTSLPQQFSPITNRVEITFTKSMDKSTIAQGVYIYPHIEAKKISLADRVLTISINEALQKNTNYYVTLSTRIKDSRGNPLKADQTLIYASGEFNDNRLAGTIQYDLPADEGQPVQMSLFSPDSLLVLSRQFSGSSYAIDGLNAADYQLRAYMDKNRNGRYDHTEEPWYQQMVRVKQNSNLDISLAYADTTLPVIRSAKAMSNREMQVTFSEAPASFANITIIDPLANKLLAVQITEQVADRLTIITSPQDSVKYELRVTGIKDAKGNQNQVSGIVLMGTKKQDTEAPRVVASIPRNGTSVASLQPTLEVHFSEIIPLAGLKATLTAPDTNVQIPLQIVSADSKVCRFKPGVLLTNYRSHVLRVLAESTDASGNKLEADYLLNFLPLIPNR